MWKMLLVAGLALWLVGCDQGDQDDHTVKVQVAAHQVACTGITQQRCYQVRFADGEPWQLYYGEFNGLDYQPGFQYWLEVRQQHVVQDNPEHSRLAWEVVKEISRTPVAATSADAVGGMSAAAPTVVTGVVPGSQPGTATTPAAPATSTAIGTSPATTGATPTDGAASSTETTAPTDDDIPPD